MPDQQNQLRGQQREKEPFLHLDTASPEREPGLETYKIIAEIWLSRWKGPSPRVQITVDGALWQNQGFFPLNQQFCLTAPITGLGLGSHTIVVVTEDGRHRNMKPINIPAPEKKPPKPARIISFESGSAGKYKVVFQVLAQDETPLSGTVVRIFDPEHQDGFYDLQPTDKSGLTKCEIVIPPGKDEKFVEVSILGTSISIWKNFYR